MQMKISVNLENCYGIHKLNHVFDFDSCQSYMLYAPNGTMKSSFALSFKDFSENKESEDRIYPERITKREIKTDNDSPLLPENILVIEPYNKDYASQQVSTLLVNKDLKQKYDSIYDNINKTKDFLISKLKNLSGLKLDEIETTFSTDFTQDAKSFFKAISRVHSEVIDAKDSPLSSIKYSKIFNPKIINELEKKEFRDSLNEYIENYDRLLSSSHFFKKGIFNHNNASDIAKSLKDNGFFRANHGVYINELGKKVEVASEQALEDIISKEKEAILNDESLQKAFNAIDKILSKNKDVREFRDYIESNKFILPELKNLNVLKQELWIAYLHLEKETYTLLYDTYQTAKQDLTDIIEKAKEERTEWIDIIDIFNKRFSVPFIVTIENQEDVILKNDTPNVVFKFKDDIGHPQKVDKDKLLNTLSNGEKRALYLLNIIFEVEARKKQNQSTLFIIDDIADSFDYKNKYAIIEYLKEISNIANFKQIILTHNFDFYRTICCRLNGERKNHLQAIKNGENILIKETKYQKNPFIYWKDHLNEKQYLIASIPFLRNLAEYCGHENEYNKLTSLLHIKQNLPELTVVELENILHTLCTDKSDTHLSFQKTNVKDILFETADEVALENDEIMELEKKIVLSIAIRLKAEEFTIKKINIPDFVDTLSKDQTYHLIEKYKDLFPNEYENIKILDEVNLMTPENIHLNSFMYEPIIDMSNTHLKRLYNTIKSLVAS